MGLEWHESASPRQLSRAWFQAVNAIHSPIHRSCRQSYNTDRRASAYSRARGAILRDLMLKSGSVTYTSGTSNNRGLEKGIRSEKRTWRARSRKEIRKKKTPKPSQSQSVPPALETTTILNLIQRIPCQAEEGNSGVPACRITLLCDTSSRPLVGHVGQRVTDGPIRGRGRLLPM